MKSQPGFVIYRHLNNGAVKRVGVVVPSRRMTNRATIDLVKDHHLQEFGRMWPNQAGWAPHGSLQGCFKLDTPIAWYIMAPVPIYGLGE